MAQGLCWQVKKYVTQCVSPTVSVVAFYAHRSRIVRKVIFQNEVGENTLLDLDKLIQGHNGGALDAVVVGSILHLLCEDITWVDNSGRGCLRATSPGMESL